MSSLVEWCWQKSDLNKFKEKKKKTRGEKLERLGRDNSFKMFC